jgi:hypothetical protein
MSALSLSLDVVAVAPSASLGLLFCAQGAVFIATATKYGLPRLRVRDLCPLSPPAQTKASLLVGSE